MFVGSVSQRYMDAAVQALLILLDYGPPQYADSPSAPGKSAGSQETGEWALGECPWWMSV
jgi:hypothetical protein